MLGFVDASRLASASPTAGSTLALAAGPGETLVRMEAAALGHLDLTVAGGEFGIRPDLPYIGGLEGAGVVV